MYKLPSEYRIHAPAEASLGLLLLALSLAGCSSSASYGHSSSSPGTPQVASTTSSAATSGEAVNLEECPLRTVDIALLLTRHARGFGSPAGVAASLPLSQVGKLMQGQTPGETELFLDTDRHRTTIRLGPAHIDAGIDQHGAWQLGLTDVLVRRVGLEAIEANVTRWIQRRTYVEETGFTARCELEGAQPIVTLSLDEREDLGRPELRFDWATAALREARYRDQLGEETRTTFESWHAASSSGVRWPKLGTWVSGGSDVMVFDFNPPTQGLRGVACEGRACLEPRAPRVLMNLRDTDAEIVVPFAFYASEVLVEVDVGGRKVDALLDSGAEVTAVDATSESGKQFVPALELGGQGVSQKIRVGFGEIDRMTMGDLELSHIPAVSVPLPVFDNFGTRRPEVVLGYTLFEAFVIRVDYANERLILSKKRREADASNSKIQWISAIDANTPIVEATIEGRRALFGVDTGNAAIASLWAHWCAQQELPGPRAFVEQEALISAGTQKTVQRLMRVRGLQIGPLDLSDPLVSITENPSRGIAAGLLGNEALGRCQAVVFDMPNRQLGIEGPCDRPRPVDRSGWRLVREGPAETPWVIRGLLKGGAADRAGVLDGDRLLEIGGRRAANDRVAIQKLTSQRAGRRIPIVVGRDGQRRRLIMTLEDILPASTGPKAPERLEPASPLDAKKPS